MAESKVEDYFGKSSVMRVAKFSKEKYRMPSWTWISHQQQIILITVSMSYAILGIYLDQKLDLI